MYLKEIGYGIDISECAVTKSKDNLKYVSPKSGRAVTQEIGLPYKDKLLEIPKFIYDAKYTDRDDLLKGLLLTEFFLKRDVYKPLQLKVTSFRASLYKLINSFETQIVTDDIDEISIKSDFIDLLKEKYLLQNYKLMKQLYLKTISIITYTK